MIVDETVAGLPARVAPVGLPVVGLHVRWSRHARVETVVTLLGDPERPDAQPFPYDSDSRYGEPSVRYCRECHRPVRRTELVAGCGPKCARKLGYTQPATRTARVPRQTRRPADDRPRPDLLDELAALTAGCDGGDG